jgi:hypothetical protein
MSEKESKNIQLGQNILSEGDLLITAQYDGEEFTLQYPDPLQKSAIEVEIARRLGGFPRSTFSSDHVIMTEAHVIIDSLYIADKCPKWFVPWKCLDERLIMVLYNAYLSFRDEFREKLRTGKYRRGS